MAVVTMRQLLDSGVHFGHQTRRWNPKMKRFILTDRNGIYIVDLAQTLQYIDKAYDFVKETVAHGGTVLFVGTKKQAQEPIAEQASRVGMPYVNQRWLGGMLTNFPTVNKRIQRLKELEAKDFDDVAASGLTKKELLMQRRERDKLARTLGGVRDMTRTPSAVWIVDTNKEHLAVDEARKLGIPIVAILDTNCDPEVVDYPIPGNDDAIRAIQLLTRVIADAVAEGLMIRHSGKSAASDVEAQPLAEWERELLEGAQSAAAQVPSTWSEDASAPAIDREAPLVTVVVSEPDVAAPQAAAPAAPATETVPAASVAQPEPVVPITPETLAAAEAAVVATEAPLAPVVSNDEAPLTEPIGEIAASEAR